MAIMMPQTQAESAANPDDPTPPAIPDFVDDQRARERYAALIERRKQQFSTDHVNAIRRHTADKRSELRDQLSAANDAWNAANELVVAANDAYAALCPHHVKRMRVVAPSLSENLRSLGNANRLYQAAADAHRALDHAASDIRRIEHNEAQLDVELRRALERAPITCAEITSSAQWLAEIHADEDVAAARARVEAIDAERAAYAERLAAGQVTPDEQRGRRFAEAGIRAIVPPVDGLLFSAAETFGRATFLIGRDLRGQRYALPYDRRLEPHIGMVVDISANGGDVVVRRTRKRGAVTAMTPLDHFLACNDGNDAAAREEYHAYQTFCGEMRSLTTNADVSEAEAKLIALLLALA